MVPSVSNPPAVETYHAVKQIRSLLDLPLHYPKETGKRRALDLPELQLMTIVVISAKLGFPFDDIKRYPCSTREATTQKMDWNAWAQAQRYFDRHQTSKGNIGKGNEILVEENDVFDLTPSQLDEYMDWYENNWLDRSKCTSPETLGSVDLY